MNATLSVLAQVDASIEWFSNLLDATCKYSRLLTEAGVLGLCMIYLLVPLFVYMWEIFIMAQKVIRLFNDSHFTVAEHKTYTL